MSSKKLEGPAFGSQSARFNLNGVHPNLLTNGHMPYDTKHTSSTSANIGPGYYDLLKYNEFSDENVWRKADGPNWEKAFYTEKMAKIPHLLYKEEYKNKLEDKKRLGPGYYNIATDVEKPHSNRGMLDALSKRFSNENINNNPGPADYGIPDQKLETKRKNKPGKVALLDWSKTSRSLASVGCEVPPGRYNHKNSIDELLNKKVSNRGPYDVFSENRSAPVKWGHYAQDLDKKLGPGQYNFKSFTDELQNKHQKKHGKFGKIEQYPAISGDRISIDSTSLRPRNPKWPGPGAYSPGEFSKFESRNPPFLSSTQRSDKRSLQFFSRNFNPVGVGRYDIQRIEETENKNGHRSIFLSKSSHYLHANEEKHLTERLKPRNLSQNEKHNLSWTGNIKGEITA